MPFPIPAKWTRESNDVKRDEEKRKESPCSFFHSQARSLVLAAEYFTDDRLAQQARGGVAEKHLHKMHLALYGQLMASFEYLLKDFVAKAIDLTPILDSKLQKAEWINNITPAKVLAYRSGPTTPGAVLVHSTLGWHDAETVNSRYNSLFGRQPISTSELPTLARLWVIRHSVAHNAGLVMHFDATRISAPGLSDSVVAIDPEFIKETFEFLIPIAERIASQVGGILLDTWLKTVVSSQPDHARDAVTYTGLKKLATMTKSRTAPVPTPTVADYTADFTRVQAMP